MHKIKKLFLRQNFMECLIGKKEIEWMEKEE